MVLLLRPCYVGVKHRQKSTQHPSKNSSQIHAPISIDFRANLAPFWEDLGAKMGPSWLQMAPKVDSKNGTKNDHLLDRFKIDFWSILGPNLAPKRCHRSLHFGAFFALGASWAQDAPKTPPRGLLGAPRPLQDASWERFLTIWGSNLLDFSANFMFQ